MAAAYAEWRQDEKRRSIRPEEGAVKSGTRAARVQRKTRSLLRDVRLRCNFMASPSPNGAQRRE